MVWKQLFSQGILFLLALVVGTRLFAMGEHELFRKWDHFISPNQMKSGLCREGGVLPLYLAPLDEGASQVKKLYRLFRANEVCRVMNLFDQLRLKSDKMCRHFSSLEDCIQQALKAYLTNGNLTADFLERLILELDENESVKRPEEVLKVLGVYLRDLEAQDLYEKFPLISFKDFPKNFILRSTTEENVVGSLENSQTFVELGLDKKRKDDVIKIRVLEVFMEESIRLVKAVGKLKKSLDTKLTNDLDRKLLILMDDYLDKECEKGISLACLKKGLFWRKKRDFEQAARYFSKVCSSETPLFCRYLGESSFYLGKVNDRNIFFNMACNKGDIPACLHLYQSEVLASNEGKGKDYLRMAAKFEKERSIQSPWALLLLKEQKKGEGAIKKLSQYTGEMVCDEEHFDVSLYIVSKENITFSIQGIKKKKGKIGQTIPVQVKKKGRFLEVFPHKGKMASHFLPWRLTGEVLEDSFFLLPSNVECNAVKLEILQK